MLDLKEIGEIGKFKEEYFIYLVDVEYCKRATTRGYKIERYLDIYLHHQTNDINNNQYARKTNKLAYYYAVRNKHYFLKEYPTDGFYNRMKELLHTYEFWLSIAKREKTTKTAIVYMLKGVIGYIRQEKGKYPG